MQEVLRFHKWDEKKVYFWDMAIESKANEDAKTSSFYLYNKEISEGWENFANDNGGDVEGGYSEWAININGNIPQFNCTFLVKKSTISNGSLLIPANKSIRHETILLFSDKPVFKEKFIIRRKSFLDKLGLSSYSSLNRYYAIQKENSLNELSSIAKYLKDYINGKFVKEMFYNNSTQQFQITFNQLIEEPKMVEEIALILSK